MYFRTAVCHFFLFLFAAFVSVVLAQTPETYFEIIDNEENNLTGVMTALDQSQVSINVQDASHIIPLNNIVKVRNISPHPYQDSFSNTNERELLQQIPSVPMATIRGTNERRAVASLQTLQSKEQIGSKALPNNFIVLDLKDGSRLTASTFTVANNQGIVRLLGQQHDLSLPLNSITAVRFTVHSSSEILNPSADWLRLAAADADGDKLVVGNSGAFDVYAGILNSITAETIAFFIDGEVLPVPRRKVFGLVLHNQPLSSTEPPLAHLSLWTGTSVTVSDFRLAGNDLSVQTLLGLNVTIPLETIEEINFGEKGIASLADLELVHSELSFPFETNITPAQLPMLKSFYENRSKSISSRTIMDGTMFEQCLTLRGKTSLEYRLSKPFSSLRAVIGIEDQYRPYASGTLKVLADSQILGTWELRGDVPSERIHLNLPQSCRLLTIITEPSQQPHIPTVLTIADLKLYE